MFPHLSILFLASEALSCASLPDTVRSPEQLAFLCLPQAGTLEPLEKHSSLQGLLQCLEK